MFQGFAQLPRPVQALVLLGSGAGLVSVVMAFILPDNPFFKWIAIGVVLVVVLLGLYKLVLMLRDKSKSGPFASLLSKSSRSATDPALKARMDELRKKFEEGVTTFKAAGKDLYSLPWYLLVGPAGSGKTEALRHCQVGFPPGLQDPLQGSGGTLSMNWWFTNHAVVLDTAGRIFMEGADEGGGAEWKEFLKLLKTARPNVPINGLLLVISSESLLKDSAEKIEHTAGAIARQLDVIQRTLDVRFPVTVVVTKCDKIVGFRDFFETVNDPNLQHQILGWSNPAPLDETFKPDQVDKHLETVRHKLMRRRMGLLQNPVHTTDANLRRTDQVDELFELPDNLVRIAPRLRRYLEMIFVAGEWSPKPLFLRGIYFTSSMREGQALDMSLAQALGVDVESIPGSRDWDREKAYFLRDLFMAKVFKEKGLVTRATNVSKALAKQRAMLVGGVMAATLVVGGLTALGYFQFNSSLGPPSSFWSDVRGAVVGNPAKDISPLDAKQMSLVGLSGSGADAQWVYTGKTALSRTIGDDVKTPAELVIETGRYKPIDPPMIARPAAPLLGFGNSFLDAQEAAHRAVVEKTTILPLLGAARSKLQEEKNWGPDAVAALAQLIRIQTWSHGATPLVESGPTLADVKDAAKSGKLPGSKEKPQAIDVDALFRYVLGEEAYKDRKGYADDRERVVQSVQRAYAAGFSKDFRPSPALGGTETPWVSLNDDAVKRLSEHLLGLGATEGSDMAKLQKLQRGLVKFDEAEKGLKSLSWLRAGTGAAAATPKDLAEYEKFEQDAGARLKEMESAKQDIDAAVDSLGSKADNALELLAQAGDQLQKDMASYFDQLLGQLPRGAENLGDSKLSEAAEKALAAKEPADLRALRESLTTKKQLVAAAVKEKLEGMRADVQRVAGLVVPGKSGQVDARAYAARYACYAIGKAEVASATAELKGTFSEQARAIDAAMTKASDGAQGWSNWLAGTAARGLPDAQRAALDTDKEDAVAVGKALARIAAARKLSRAVEDSLKAWAKDADEMGAGVKARADAKIESGEMKRADKPRLKLTELEDGGEFDRRYHPEAGRDAMGDFREIRRLVEPGSSGQPQLMGAEAIKAGRGYRSAADVTDAYAKQYIAYWKGQALDATRVTSKNWDEFAKDVKGLFPDTVRGPLGTLSEVTEGALAAVPEGVTKATVVEEAKREVQEAYSGLKTTFAGDDFRKALGQWRNLANAEGGAEAAAGVLRGSYKDGTIQDLYFALYQGKGAGKLSYWNGLIEGGLNLLIAATQGENDRAQQRLMTAKAAPVCFGDESLADLSPAELNAVRDAVARLSSSGGGAAVKPGAGAANLEPELRSLVNRLFGANFIERDAGTRKWFGDLTKVVEKVAGKDPVKLSLNLLSEDPPSGAGGKAHPADDGLKFAALFVNGKKVGEAFNIFSLKNIPADKAKALVVTLPVQSSSIGLYREDPGNTDRAPDEQMPLAGSWSLLGAMLRGPNSDVVGGGAWRVMVSNERHHLWMTIKIDPEVPAKGEWPVASKWPSP